MESHITAETRHRMRAGALAQAASICMILGCCLLLGGSAILGEAAEPVGCMVAIVSIYLVAPTLGAMACLQLLRYHRSADEVRHPCLLHPTGWDFNLAAELFALTGLVAVVIMRTVGSHIQQPASHELLWNVAITISPLLAVALGGASHRLLARGRRSYGGCALATFAIVLGLLVGIGPWIAIEAVDLVRR